MSRFVVVATLALGLAACAGSRQYQCPQPIGTIVREDCEVYRTRYEATRVGLAAGISEFKLEGSVEQQALRDPSELIQVMGARLVALCHDFNACRITPREYAERRDEIDHTMTAIAAISEQLKQPGLQPKERRSLLERLMGLLAPPPSPGGTRPPARGPQPGTSSGSSQPPVEKQRRFFSSSEPWMGTRFLPPQPPSPQGFPRLLPAWGVRTLDHVWVPRSPTTPQRKKIGGWMLRTGIYLAGNLEADDRVEISLADGRRYGCPVRRHLPQGGRVSCRSPQDIFLTGSSFSAEVYYQRAASGRQELLGRVERQVRKSHSGGYCVDYDERLGQGWLYFLPEPRYLPAEFERPYLRVTLRLRTYRKATARCFVGTESITGALRTSRGSGQTGTCQDRPRWRQVDEHTSRPVPHPFIRWQHYEFGLPYVVPRQPGRKPPAGLSTWPPRSGEWRCRVTVEGQPVRELRFTIDANGRPRPGPHQQGRPGDLAGPWWQVETRILPNQVEDLPAGGAA